MDTSLETRETARELEETYKYLYAKGRKNKDKCSSYISTLSVLGKVYGRVLPEKLVGETEGMISELQCGFRNRRGC